MAGVTLAVFRQYYGEDRTAAELARISDEQWGMIMKRYWDQVKGDSIVNQSIAELVADWNVNSGRSGIKALQRAIGLEPDGIIGPKSLSVLNSPNQAVIFNRIYQAREKFFLAIVKNNPSQKVFLNGWMNRLRLFSFSE